MGLAQKGGSWRGWDSSPHLTPCNLSPFVLFAGIRYVFPLESRFPVCVPACVCVGNILYMNTLSTSFLFLAFPAFPFYPFHLSSLILSAILLSSLPAHLPRFLFPLYHCNFALFTFSSFSVVSASSFLLCGSKILGKCQKVNHRASRSAGCARG